MLVGHDAEIEVRLMAVNGAATPSTALTETTQHNPSFDRILANMMEWYTIS